MASTHGGARFTHAALVLRDLDYLAIEAQLAQEDFKAGRMTYKAAARRYWRFSQEVERLSRSGARHLRLVETEALERAA